MAERRRLTGTVISISENKIRQLGTLRHILGKRANSNLDAFPLQKDILNNLAMTYYNRAKEAGWTDEEIKLLTGHFRSNPSTADQPKQ